MTLVPGTALAVRPTGVIVPATATSPGGLRTQSVTESTPAGVAAIAVSGTVMPGTTGAVMAVLRRRMTHEALRMTGEGHRMVGEVRHPTAELHYSMMAAAHHRTIAGAHHTRAVVRRMTAEGRLMMVEAHPTTAGGHHMTAEGRRMTAVVRHTASGGLMCEAILGEGILGAS